MIQPVKLIDCVNCEVKYIEDCKYIEVAIGGKPVLPARCWRREWIKLTAKPHDHT